MKTAKIFFILSLIFFNSLIYSQDKINVVLLGTYHFNNPGNDAIKSEVRNILEPKNQAELEEITDLIYRKLKPDQIFVEEEFSKKAKLNQLYQAYLNNSFDKITDTISNARFKKKHKENEIYQLAFRLGKKAKNDSIYPIDHFSEMRFDLLQKKAGENEELKNEFSESLKSFSNNYKICINEIELIKTLKCLNTAENRLSNKGFYVSLANKIGVADNYFGANLVADWYRRNLLIYANFQAQIKKGSKNVLILVGAGHSAMIYDLIKNDKNFNLIEVDEILQNF